MADNNEFELLDNTSIKDSIELEPPGQYRIILHNDDYTPMEFVIEILIEIFSKNETQAAEIMLNVHRLGQGICGVFPYEIAESKLIRTHNKAKQMGFPLLATMEKD
jgi:ATP-dependent Clp protease adaptor protein ClpS